MSMLKRLFGRGQQDIKAKQAPAKPSSIEILHQQGSGRKTEKSVELMADAAAAFIKEALATIEKHVNIGPETVIVSGTGSDGEVMQVAEKLKRAFETQPDNPQLHYAYASALHLAMQFKTAEEEMRKCSMAWPDFHFARLAIEGWPKWQSMFTLPHWGSNTEKVHPAISQTVKTNILLSTRDGIVPRTTLFLRDAQDDFQDLRALRSAKIDLATVISPVTSPQIVAICGRIYDNPDSPYAIEVTQAPFSLRGDKVRARMEYLCLQDDIDFVVLSRGNEVLLNKRLPFPPKMVATNRKILQLLSETNGSEISPSDFMSAMMKHQRMFNPSQVQY